MEDLKEGAKTMAGDPSDGDSGGGKSPKRIRLKRRARTAADTELENLRLRVFEIYEKRGCIEWEDAKQIFLDAASAGVTHRGEMIELYEDKLREYWAGWTDT